MSLIESLDLAVGQKIFLWTKKKYFAQRGARTHDPEIKSLMLYRLS